MALEKISPQLHQKMGASTEDAFLFVIVQLVEKFGDEKEIGRKRRVSKEEREAMLKEGEEEIKRFVEHLEQWSRKEGIKIKDIVPNPAFVCVSLTATRGMIEKLSELEEVASIIEDQPVTLIPPVRHRYKP